MLSYGHNDAISMDATFGTNDMKFHLFTLMGFDDHHTSVPLTWISTSKQIVQDLIEWLKPLKDKMLSHMPHWKPLCFLVDDSRIEGITINFIFSTHFVFISLNVFKYFS